MPSFTSGWIIWNAGSALNPNFVPKQIYPPALQVAELTETVYATQAEAQAAINSHGGAKAYNAATAAGGLGSGAIGPAGNAAQTVYSGVNAVGDFFNKLSEGNTWLRIAEAILGIALIGIALAKLTGADNVVAKGVTTAAKVVK